MTNRSPVKQWLVDGRGQMKVEVLAERLTAAGYRTRDDEPVKVATIRGWEAPAGGDPPRAVIPYLEKILKSNAPTDGQSGDTAALIRALTENAAAMTRLADEMHAVYLLQLQTAQSIGAIVGLQEGLVPGDSRTETPSETPAEDSPGRPAPTNGRAGR